VPATGAAEAAQHVDRDSKRTAADMETLREPNHHRHSGNLEAGEALLYVCPMQPAYQFRCVTFLQGYIDTLITQLHTIYLSSALMNKAGLPQGRLTGKRGSMCGATSHVGTRQAGGVRVQSISRPPERASGRIPGTGGLLTQALERQNTGMITGAGSAAEVVICGVTLHLGGTAAEHSMHTAAAETIAPRVATGGRMSLTGDLRRRSVLGR
jgi:hypothetical protein